MKLKLSYTDHAKKRITQRKISREIIEEVIEYPEFTEEQEDGCVRYYRYIQELGHYLRVVCRGNLVITAMPDRTVTRSIK